MSEKPGEWHLRLDSFMPVSLDLMLITRKSLKSQSITHDFLLYKQWGQNYIKIISIKKRVSPLPRLSLEKEHAEIASPS